MRLLIDGYNLLHVTDLFGQGASLGTLHGSREALLEFLARTLSAGERRATTIVFDAAGAPPGLPATIHFDHITARFARNYPDADTLLEEIIEDHRAPRGLLVVSSDHRVSRAARRRGAKTVDSDVWFAERRANMSHRSEPSARPRGEGGGTTADWIRLFSTPEVAELERQLHQGPTPSPQTPRRKKAKPKPRATEEEVNFENPFPPGYGEDLLAGE